MSSPEEFLNIDTPENVVFGYEIVGIGSRFIAGLIDNLIIFIVLGIFTLVLVAIGNSASETMRGILVAIGILISFIFFWGYYIYFEVRKNGRSPGKEFAHIRVIRQDGTPITLTESIVRNLVRIIDFFPGGYGLGIVTMFIDGQSRRLGDIIAGTVVVRDEESVTLNSLQEKRPSVPLSTHNNEEELQRWPVHLLEEDDVRLAEEFLRRQSELSNRYDMAYGIAKTLLVKMNMPTTEAVFRLNALRSIEGIVAAYRRHSSTERSDPRLE